MTYRANFLRTARLQDRGGVLGDTCEWQGNVVKIDRRERDYPCTMVLRTASIDYNGDVFLCYNMRHDHPDHQAFCVGNVNDTDFVEILQGEKAKEVQRLANMTEGFPEVCRNCTNRREVKRIED